MARLGNHPPRQCGIATFNRDLSDAIAVAAPELDCYVLAMNDAKHHHACRGRVRFELSEVDLWAYRRAGNQ